MSSRSMADVAYELMSKRKREVPFNKIWDDVSKTMGLNETQAMNKIASFYSALMLDPRFTLLPSNKWDLRDRHTYNETHIDTSSLVDDDDEEEEEAEDEDFDEDENKENDEDRDAEDDEAKDDD